MRIRKKEPNLLIFFLVLVLVINSNNTLESYNGSSEFNIPNFCTIFTVAIGDRVYFGNNEDYRLEGTYMWVMPSQEIVVPSGNVTTYGALGFGFKYNNDPADGYVQGGMNDQGLCADGNGLPVVSLNPHPERESPYIGIITQILFECSTVNETIEWFQTHNLGTVWSCQIHFADASGDAVVVSAGTDGEFAFTRKNDSRYLISTNFNLVNYQNGWYPCNRYNTATSMLNDITTKADLTVEACRDVLDAVHAEGEYATKYSNIFDPINLKLYLYQNRNYDELVSLNIADEISKVHPGDKGVIDENGLYYKETTISSLFEFPTTTSTPISVTTTTTSESTSITLTSTGGSTPFLELILIIPTLVLISLASRIYKLYRKDER